MDDDDEELIDMLPDVNPCRGRESLPESQVEIGFTRDELDSISDLPDAEEKSIRVNDPTEEAKEMLRERIRAARILKYGH